MEAQYNDCVDSFREEEYPMLKDAIYLDHAATTLCPKSLLEQYTKDLMSNLYGNPHSASLSSQRTTNCIEDIRSKALNFFGADPEDFDLVFVGNATAGIKLIGEAFRELEGGFTYGYHSDSHTSLVGLREIAGESRCLDDEDVETWISGLEDDLDAEMSRSTSLLAYPAQSNMDGRRFPFSWLDRIKEINNCKEKRTYTLLDVSSFVSTSPLQLSGLRTAPDFTVLSFYKIFGFPDLGAVIVKKDAGSIFRNRKYFGGGTVDVVLCRKEQWHVSKSESIHASLEDGTLPFHNILALDAAMDIHQKLYGSMEQISSHTALLADRLCDGLRNLRHSNSDPVCVVYSKTSRSKTQGPIVAFNLRNIHGAWVSNNEFEKLASVKGFHVRSGGLCNPGGIASKLELEPWEVRKNFSAGFRCGAETDIYAGKITGVIRASVGAMSTTGDVENFVAFVGEFFAEKEALPASDHSLVPKMPEHLAVESLTVYPIKSCGGFQIAPGVSWEVRLEGLAWDREWCLVHLGTGQALSQKRHPRMALIRPAIDLANGFLNVSYHGSEPSVAIKQVAIPLSSNPSLYKQSHDERSLRVCGDAIVPHTYASAEVNKFFCAVLGIPCVLARFPAGGSGYSTRHSKAHMAQHQCAARSIMIPGSYLSPPTPPDSDGETSKRPILLSNESPILVINRASLEELNEQINRTGGRPASASVFRSNIVVASPIPESQIPYAEDKWKFLRIAGQRFEMLGSCRRCHMICVDQETAEKNEEPFVTLAKTRRFESKVFFGTHMCHVPSKDPLRENQYPTIRIGDLVTAESDA